MKRIVKLKLGAVVCTLLFATAINAYGTNIKEEIESPSINNVAINERYIVVPDSTILLQLWDEQLDNGKILPFYSISLDGGQTNVRTVQPSYELGLRYSHFDPLEEVPVVEPILAAGADTHLFIVQFFTQPLEEFKESIIALGGSVHHYIAQLAYLVEMSESVKLQVESLPYVRWVGPYHPAYRLEEFMLDNFENAEQMYPLQRYNIQVHTVEMKNLLANQITALGGTVDRADAGKFLVEATLTPEQLFTVVRLDEVLFVDRWGPYEVDMDIAREIGGANYIESVAGYDGAGVRGESFDTGFNLAHVDFASRPLIVHGGTVPMDSHGSACIGICFGDGTGNPQARGLLPAGQGIVAYYNNIGLSGTNRYIHTGELVQSPYYAVFQTASVGSPRTTQYTTISADTDVSLFDFDIVHCQSQSNSGWEDSRPQAWAKNIISGGGVRHYDTLDKSDDCWCSGASIGPASDGRIKPTFTHFYDNILTTTSGSSTAYTSSFGGTSGATPIIAGHVGLFFQMWSDGIFGNEVNPSGTVFENKAHMTTAKAMLINTAEQYDFSGPSHDKTRMHQGWGMPNLQNMYDLRDKFYIIDESEIIEPFEVIQHGVAVEAGEPSFKVTMTYADPPGNPAVQTQHRINDLTLKVISPSGGTYWGNNGLDDGIWSTTGGAPDTKNTVECVFVENPEQGSWIIEVSADEIIQDSHVETTELDADYALVVSPALSGPFPPEINGPAEGAIGRENEFTIVTTDPENFDLYYYIYWGDGTYDDWFGPYASGEEVTVSHAWFEKGNFSIRAKAKSSLGVQSSWSDPFLFSIFAPQIKIGVTTGGFFRVNAVITNIGDIEATDVNWSIKLNGGNIYLGAVTKGTIASIPVDGQVNVISNLIIGSGETEIKVSGRESWGSYHYRTQGAKMFWIYIKVNPGGG